MGERAHNFKDLTGEVFGRLTVQKVSHTNKHKQIVWQCYCECGTEVKLVVATSLRNGNTRSCGCLAIESKKVNKYKHGGSRKDNHEIFYDRWASMKDRCQRENNPSYKNYGGRGINVCDEWQEYSAFREWALKSEFKPGMQIDRIDNDKGYSPENCKWSTFSENQSNKRSNNLVEINGVTKTLTQWANESGISFFSLRSRQVRGWKPEQLLLPIGTKRKDL